MTPSIFPAIIAKSQPELNQKLKKLSQITKTFHLDVIDGKFAPNHSLDFPLKLPGKFKYRAHLMVKHPEKWINKYESKVELVIPQIEEIKDLSKYILGMKSRQKKVAFALNPATKVKVVKPHLKNVDFILILTVQPGFYGGRYLKSPLKKINQIKQINPKIKIIVDGGMSLATIKEAAQAGADYFVSGSYLMNSANPAKALRELKKEIKKVKR